MAAPLPNTSTLMVFAAPWVVLLFLACDGPPTASGPRSRLEIDLEVHDLGQSAPGYLVTDQYTFRNTGQAPLVIEKVTSSCGCTVPELAQREYQPGESGLLQVNVTVREGKKRMLVYLHTNDPEAKMVTLRLQAEGIKAAHLEPASFDFTGLKLGEEAIRQVAITAGDGRLFTVSNPQWNHIEGTHGGIKLEPVDEEDGRARKWMVTIRLKPDEYISDKTDYRIQFKSDLPRLANFRIPLRLVVRHPLQLEKGPRHFLGVAGPGETAQAEVVLASDDGAPFKILEANSTLDPAFGITSEPLENGARHRLTITATVPGNATQGFRGTRFLIRTDRSGTPDIQASFSIHVLAP